MQNKIDKLVENFKDYPLNKIKCPKNESEKMLFETMTEKGWICSKKGWPDFFAFKKDNGKIKIALIEVKAKHTHRLKKMQVMVLELLAQYNVPCYRWSPDKGFEQIMGETIE